MKKIKEGMKTRTKAHEERGNTLASEENNIYIYKKSNGFGKPKQVTVNSVMKLLNK